MSLIRLTFDAGTLLLESGSVVPSVAGDTQYTSLNAQTLARWFGQGIWVWDPRVSKWRTDAYHYADLHQAITLLNLPIKDTIRAAQFLNEKERLADRIHESSANSLPSLRPEQIQAIQQWEKTGRGIIVMPTGTGKTEVALAILARRIASHNAKISRTPDALSDPNSSSYRSLIVAPVRDLMYQWHRRILRGLKIDAGILGDTHRQIRAVTVTTYASACIHATELGNAFDLLIFDECHHLTGPIRADAARCSMAPSRLGLTATLPEQTDALVQWIGPVQYELKMEQVRGSTLADYEVVRIPIELNPQERARYKNLSQQISKYVYERRKTDPEFAWKDLCAEASKGSEASRIMRLRREKDAIEDRAEEKLRILEDLFRLHLGESMVIFTGSNAMARAVSLRFLIPCLLSHCGKHERLDYIEGLRDGIYPAIVANQVLDEGVDLPEVKVAIVLGGKGSIRQAKQRLGRILRKRGNRRAILYEVVATETKEVNRSRKRRNNDAYEGTRHRQFRKRTDPS